MVVNLTTVRFITKAKEIHGDRYSYELVDYCGCYDKVKITCPIHGIFEQIAYTHIQGRGCQRCKGGILSTKDVFVTKANNIHNILYDYSLVEYVNNKTKVKIICPIHGVFEQIPNSHLKGRGCPVCFGTTKLTTEQFITKAKEIHGGRYDYSLVEYVNNKTKVKIICPIHGIFEQVPDSHLKGNNCQQCYFLKRRQNMVDSLPPDDGAYIDDNDIINCKCHYCGKYHKPTISELNCRYKVMVGKSTGSYNFYCSDECKQQCSVFAQKKHPKGVLNKTNTSREVQPQLRKLVFERDDYTCQKCGFTDSLHCHHITGVELNPIESADVDNCITLCKGCHKGVHSQDGCSYQDYKRKRCEE